MNPAGQAVGVLVVVKLHEQVLATALVCVQAGAGLIVYLVVILPVSNPGPHPTIVLEVGAAQGINEHAEALLSVAI